MQVSYGTVQSIKNWKNTNLSIHRENHTLHLYHEFVIKRIFEITLKEMMMKYGPPPCEFSWFVMGSAARCEQGIISDQDHGFLFSNNHPSATTYFLTFGKLLTSVLNDVGYPLCEGNVMCSNPLWCHSEKEWEIQIKKWIEQHTWQSIRYLLIFIDARVVVGDEKKLLSLKRMIYRMIQNQPFILERILENTKYHGKAIGLFNHFLTNSTGPYTGFIDLKSTAYFPYVNAIRLLSIIENIEAISTLARMEALSSYEKYKQIMAPIHSNFTKLLQYRCLYNDVNNYEAVHFLNLKRLNKLEKLEFKKIFKDIKMLQKFTEKSVQEVLKNEG